MAGVPCDGPNGVRHLQRPHRMMISVDVVGDGGRGVDGVDHRDRPVVQADIFARRHTRRSGFGDDVGNRGRKGNA